MKKTIPLIIALALLAGGLGGFAYAQGDHNTMTGLKLIGMGRLGSEMQIGGKALYLTRFAFTNPDCASNITIRQVSVIRCDGTVIYEGDLLEQTVEAGEVIDSQPWMSPMVPHECRSIVLWTYFPDGDGGWMSREEVLAQDAVGYTAEIFYTKSTDALPLIGQAGTSKKLVRNKKVVAEAGFRNEMFNLKQILEPE